MEERKYGIVKFFNARRGYGFLAEQEGNADWFFHHSAIKSSKDFKIVHEGDNVTFSIGTDTKGRTCAMDVEVVGQTGGNNDSQIK